MIARILKSQSKGRDERTLFTIAIVTSLLLIVILLGVYVSRNSANTQQANIETAAVQKTLEDARRALGARADALTESLPRDSFAGSVAPKPLANGGGQTWLVDLSRDFASPQGQMAPLFARLAPVAANISGAESLRGPLADGGGASAWGHAQTLIATADGQAWIVAIAPHLAMADKGRPAVLLAQKIDERLLADLARAANTQRLDLAPVAALDADAAAVPLDRGSSDLALVWRVDRPGDEIVDHNAFFLLVFAVLFATLIVFHSRRVTTAAVEREQQARADTGQDPMTGLPNRVLFMKLLESEVERVKRSINDRGAAIMLIDIDRLAEVNAASGEDIGDRLIVALTRRVTELLRASGRLARIGGDEFAILQTDIVGPRDAEILARRIVEALAEPIDVDGRKFYVTVSMGIVLCPIDADEAEELMRRAGLALYRAKNAGRNGFCFFEEQTGERLALQKAVEDDLRSAIDEGSLQLLYQPVMEGSGKRMVGVEALVRWPHPAHGFISPQNFIALAEECGLILPLGEWVLRRAMTDLRDWPGLRVAVNVSGVQLRDRGFVEMLQAMLKQFDVDPARLELEVTENILLMDADAAEEAMISVRAMGVRLALDDFGTGYSSLIYLRRFAFDKIKIDKSFLESMEATGESAIIVHSIVHLGRALGLTVTAEGVETADQLRFLQALACHELQGYLFSKPVEAAEITRRLMTQIGEQQPEQRRAVA